MCNLLEHITQNGQIQSCDTIALKRRYVGDMRVSPHHEAEETLKFGAFLSS